jgi:hypothetical protein
MKMAAEFHEFDPDGDLLLILSYPPEEDTSLLSDNDAVSVADTSTTDEIGMRKLRYEDPIDYGDTSVNMSKALERGLRPGKQAHMLVSSKVLMLISPVFKAMLSNNTFREGNELRSTGKLSLPLPDDNPDAMRVLMDIAHHRNRQVAKKLSFGMLVHLSILVDKYQMLETVENFVDLWISDDSIRSSLSVESYQPQLLPLLSIAWVFKLPTYFMHLTGIAMLDSTMKIGEGVEGCKYDGVDLPIPGAVIGMRYEEHRKVS